MHWLIERTCRELRRYEHRGNSLDDLLHNLAWCPITGRPRKRSQYIQRREACIAAMQVLLRHIDLLTLRVGVAPDGKVLGVRLDTVAEACGLDDRRLDRAIADLRASGILRSKPRAERVAEGYRGRTAVRTIAADLWSALGLAGKLAKVRAQLYRLGRSREAQRASVSAAAAQARMALAGAAQASPATPRPRPLPGDPRPLLDYLRGPPRPRTA